MKKIILRAMCAILTLVLLIPLASCAGGKKKLPDKQTLENVYTTQALSLDDETKQSLGYFQTPSFYGGEIYFYTSDYNYNEETGESFQLAILQKLNIETQKLEKCFELKGQSSSNQETQEYTSNNYNNLVVASDGTVWGVQNNSYSCSKDPDNYVYENNINIIKANLDGEITGTYNVKDIIGGEENNIWVNTILTDVCGGLFISIGNKYYLFDNDMKLKNKIDLGTDIYGNLTKTGDGSVAFIANYYDDATQQTKTEIYRLESDGSKFTKLDTAAESLMDVYYVFSGEGSTFYYQNSSGLRSFDITTGETKEVINWLNSDINSNRISSVAYIGDGKFLISENNRDYSSMNISILSPAGEVVEKYIIRLASVWLDDGLKDAIIDFNRKNEEYRITFVDYSQYNTNDDYNAGTTRLNNDIIAGNIPDIIDMNGLDFDTYASKGILADIGKLMDADSTFNRSEYLENILKATEYKGKLLSIIPNYSIQSYAVKEENIGGNKSSWTMADLAALREKFPNAEIMSSVSRSEVLSIFCNTAIKNYIDTETGKCNFNSDEFYKFLELTKEFPEEVNYDHSTEDDWKLRESAFRENRVLIDQFYIYSYDRILSEYNNAGGPVSIVGFPVPTGTGNTIIPSMEIALSASSPYTDVCWQLIKYLLSSEYQDSAGNYTLSIRKDKLEAMAQKAIEDSKNNSSGDLIVYDTAYYGSAETTNETVNVDTDTATDNVIIDDPIQDGNDNYNQNSKYTELTQDMIDRVNAAIEATTIVNRYSDTSDYYKIIEEEAGAFFAGQKSVQEVAGNIQSRIQLIVQERS